MTLYSYSTPSSGIGREVEEFVFKQFAWTRTNLVIACHTRVICEIDALFIHGSTAYMVECKYRLARDSLRFFGKKGAQVSSYLRSLYPDITHVVRVIAAPKTTALTITRPDVDIVDCFEKVLKSDKPCCLWELPPNYKQIMAEKTEAAHKLKGHGMSIIKPVLVPIKAVTEPGEPGMYHIFRDVWGLVKHTNEGVKVLFYCHTHKHGDLFPQVNSNRDVCLAVQPAYEKELGPLGLHFFPIYFFRDRATVEDLTCS